MIKIGLFSKMAKTTIKTLRYYDEIGLFHPAFIDENGYRYYQLEQLNDLNKIVSLRNLDLSIEEIKQYLNGASLENLLSAHLEKLNLEKSRIIENISLTKKYMAIAKEGNFMEEMQVREIMIPDYDVYYAHGVIPTMNDLFDFVLKAGEECRKNNPTLECENYCFITYTAKEYKETNVEIEYVEAIKVKLVESEHIKFKHLKGGKALSIEHKGAYSNLSETYSYILNYCKEHQYEIVDEIREVYIDGCWNKENEEDYLTEIQVPVR